MTGNPTDHVVRGVTEGKDGWISLRDAERAGVGSYNSLRGWCRDGMPHALVDGPKGREKPLVRLDDVRAYRASKGKLPSADRRRGRRKRTDARVAGRNGKDRAPIGSNDHPTRTSAAGAWKPASDAVDEQEASRLADAELARDARDAIVEAEAVLSGEGAGIDRAKLLERLWALSAKTVVLLQLGTANGVTMSVVEQKECANIIKLLGDQARAIEKRLDDEAERDGKMLDRAHANRLLTDLAAMLRARVEAIAVDLPERVVDAMASAGLLAESDGGGREAAGRIVNASVRELTGATLEALADQVERQAGLLRSGAGRQ